MLINPLTSISKQENPLLKQTNLKGKYVIHNSKNNELTSICHNFIKNAGNDISFFLTKIIKYL